MKLAVVILGVQNSGKTETLRKIVKKYTGLPQKQMKAGWRFLSIFKEKIWELKLHAFFVPASPSETKYKLEDRILDLGHSPEIIFLAEQTDGENRKSTFDFLEENKYKILDFELSNKNGGGIWDRFTPESKEEKLDTRTKEVITRLKEEIKAVLLKKN
ncbi:hypothetical protein EO244_00580 [Ancylomarina salipaludis]|uniref:G domain-containing protein n=1 Tax=Ancylomarina salipaludis TaxID=2501299 RepID=A0A4V1N0I7_9BACT|nr:hypothetical protein [Ancylomarina salipaludis]RXQ97417.1 hypothetical protein EO244_00580 [Ancylomarina salipaludis]